MSAYAKLESRFRELSLLEDVGGILHWDASTHLPSGAAHTRGEQMAALSGMEHRLINAPDVKDWLDEAKRETLTDWQQANLTEMQRKWTHATCIPEALDEELSRLSVESEHVWFEARKDDDFPRMRPYLEQLLVLTREVAALRGEALQCSAYDAMLDYYDPGMRMTTIDRCFSELEAFLPDAITGAQKNSTHTDSVNLSAPLEAQRTLSVTVLEKMGFDFTQGRLDESVHPFCGGAKGDIRITTRYTESDLSEALFGVLHESGHGLYERQLPEDWRYQPVGEARGMSLHESQSLLIEMQLGQSKAFADFLTPIISEICGRTITPGMFYAATSVVKPGLIRVTADEVTYPIHIILRYRLEKAMLRGDLAVKDLPGAWSDGMDELLGIRPETDRDGCLQDIHWPGGAFGYFPTYTMGALIAAQLMEAIRRDLRELESDIRAGQFNALQNWLSTHVHGLGSRYSTMDIVEQATGKPLGTEAFTGYIGKKYLGAA